MLVPHLGLDLVNKRLVSLQLLVLLVTTSTSTSTTTADSALNIKADIRNAIISLLESDDEHMAGIISAISVVIVEKLADNSVFAQKVAECLVQSGFNETVKQDVYEACDMNLKKAEDETEAVKQRMSENSECRYSKNRMHV